MLRWPGNWCPNSRLIGRDSRTGPSSVLAIHQSAHTSRVALRNCRFIEDSSDFQRPATCCADGCLQLLPRSTYFSALAQVCRSHRFTSPNPSPRKRGCAERCWKTPPVIRRTPGQERFYGRSKVLDKSWPEAVIELPARRHTPDVWNADEPHS